MVSDYNADIHAKDANGYTPLHYLIESKHPKQWSFIIKMHHPYLQNSTAPSGLSHLHIACFVDCFEAVKTLLTQKVDAEATIDPSSKESMLAPYLGFRPIHFAVKNSDYYSILKLIENGADLFKKSANGLSPLYTASESWKDKSQMISLVIDLWTYNEELMKLFKEKTGLNLLFVNVIDNIEISKMIIKLNIGLTELHIACGRKDIKLVEKIVYRNSDINRVTLPDSPIWPSCTPLHVVLSTHTLEHNSKKLFKFLVYAEASMTITNGEGLTPLHLLFYYEDHRGV